MTTLTRPYLQADDRRHQLLDAAARCFAREGYAGLTMVAVAAEASVSRRLVYNHFPDLAALYEAFFDDRASLYLAIIDRAVAEANGDARGAFDGAFRNFATMPADDQRVIRGVVSDPGMPELVPLRDRVRTHVEARWLPYFRTQTGDDETARGLLWTMVSALLGLADLVARAEISLEAAMTLAHALVATVPSALTAAGAG
jgi:AcrR family transcriptional regulator